MTGRAILRLSPIALLVLVAACGGGKKTQTTTEARATVPIRVYLLHDHRVQPVRRLVPVQPSDAYAALQSLDAPLTSREKALGLTTAVRSSAGLSTDARSVAVYTQKTPGRDALAQMVYTLTPFAGRRAVLVDGKRYTRADFEQQTPAILVESPLPDSRVTSPLHVTGTANTFEATFQYELEDAAGKILAKHFVTATSGNGVRGTFDVSIPFTVTKEQPGTLTVYEDSAATGKRINESAVPLTLAP